ncbi:DNA starvation/stationary phase protection protein [Parageobacillus sp. VR-IP]|uniref:Dps family protein n=1 Tax=Parageobacillus sp. VR-IP TaxID=2742205 RepID=UPI00158258C1|nr:Dps family protein [Parageobacillus sp. VR-IP]NUK30538.1 DNA starvation/stationary phase protection protein [Parageobacillus sp. VR-IP]
MSKQLTDIVNKQIANWSVLYIKLHNYHWYVKGSQFFTLHEKFEQLYDEAAHHIDDLAEHLLALGEAPVATMKEYLEQASVKEATGQESAEQMVATIVSDFETMIGELKEGMQVADEVGDKATEDMLLGIYKSLEKHVWMLKSFLGR